MTLNNAHEGYDYQDLLTSYFILKEILEGRKNSLFSIDKKNTSYNIPDRFDDLVIINDVHIQRKQIKYSNDNVARKLIKNDFANDSKKLALFELYRTWKELNTSNSEFRLCLAWDEPTEDNIKNLLEPISSESSFSDFPTKLYKVNIDYLWEENSEPLSSWRNLKTFVIDKSIDRNDFKLFCDSLVIELKLPKASLKFSEPSDLENILLHQAERLGIGQYPNDDTDIYKFLEQLKEKVSGYRTRSAEVIGEEVLHDLGVKTDFGKIEQKFEIDQAKNIKSEDRYNSFYNEVKTNKKTLLIGEPGSGKSWFLTNFIEYLDENSKQVIRHYCFTDTEDEWIEKRVSSDVFFGNLVADIVDKFPELEKKKNNRLVSNLEELNLLLSHIDSELIIIIDGLDHINRVLKNSSTLSEDKTKIIEYISQIVAPDNIAIVLGSQPVNEIQYLVDDFEYIDYRLPKWILEDSIQLMNKYSLQDDLLENKLLSAYLFEKSEGNPLYLTYIIKMLMNQSITIELIKGLPQYDFNLQEYYEYLIHQVEDNLTSEILSCLEFSVNKDELEELIPRSSHLENNLKILSPVLNENYARGGIKLYHDSFRRFNLEKLRDNLSLKEVYGDIAKWLNNQGFYKNPKSYRYLLNYYIKIDKFKKVKKYATNDFLTKSLYNGYSKKVIKRNYDNFLYVAKESQDWGLFIYISELNRTINATLSDNQIDEFEERFELYFEAIGLIYGFERANEILFFDGEKNFSDDLIAKAFYISQKNGVVPNWKKIDKYFNSEITIDKFKYFIAFQITRNKLDESVERNKIFLLQNEDYFKILVDEVYGFVGFEQILVLYEKCHPKYKNIIANKVNMILDDTTCKRRILIVVSKKHICLPDLNLNFIDDYIREGVLDEFYFLVRQYSIYNIDVLINFEKTIPSKNFFYNWLKFLIRNFIIEAKIIQNIFSNYDLLEQEFVENFKFLASDVEPFKGVPRAIDMNSKMTELFINTLELSLKYIKTKKAWKEVIKSLKQISFGTIGYLKGSQMGILNYGDFIDILLRFLSTENQEYIEKIILIIDNMDENYSYKLEYKLKKSLFYSKINKIKISKKELKNAMLLVTGYTFHKDRTLIEIINPLDSVNQINNVFAIKYIKKLKYLTDAIIKHTDDGKDTRWLTIEWFEKFLVIDSKFATIYLINQFIEYEYFWKLEFMFVDYIKTNKASLHPIILNFLHRLLPTNTKDSYIESYADNIYKLISIDERLSSQSLVNILNRDLNNSYDSLSKKTTNKLIILKNLLHTKIPIEKIEREKAIPSTYGEKNLEEKLTIQFTIDESLKEKSIEEINKYFKKRDRDLSDKDLNFLLQYFNEKDNDELVKSILEPLICRRLIGEKSYYEKLRGLVNHIRCSSELKVYLLVKIFIFSQGGWFENFLNKNSLKDAVKINKEQTLFYLSQELFEKFKTIYYYSQSTANLIIAFEYAGLKKKHILSMYKSGFEFIKYRLPDDNNFNWNDIENEKLENMSSDEIAIVIILTKSKNTDSLVQKEILSAINYLLNYDENLLIKPFKWFFDNISSFPHLSVASILELFLLYTDSKQNFFQLIRDDLIKVRGLENLYISNNLEKLLEEIQ